MHRAFARLLLQKQAVLAKQYHIAFDVVGVSDSRGAICNDAGLDLAKLLAHKEKGHSVATFAEGEALPDSPTLARTCDYDILMEASPVNLTNGEPALGCVRLALQRGRSAVLANKAPLVLDFIGLHELARKHAADLAYSATVCGGLPVINVGQRDLTAADIVRVEGIFNSTSNYILTRMAAGEPYEDALAEAQRRGLAETDPTLDVDGWDTANKLVIIANGVLGAPAQLADVSVEGIRALTRAQIERAQAAGKMYRLIAAAERRKDGWRFEVAPRALPKDSFLGSVDGWEMGIVFHSDIFETIYLKVDEREPTATAAAMLRDAVRLGIPCASSQK